MQPVQDLEDNFSKAETRRVGATLDDAAGCTIGGDAHETDLTNSAFSSFQAIFHAAKPTGNVCAQPTRARFAR